MLFSVILVGLNKRYSFDGFWFWVKKKTRLTKRFQKGIYDSAIENIMQKDSDLVLVSPVIGSQSLAS